MHPLAAPGTLWVLSRVGKYLVRPQADETSHKKQISCGWQGKELYFFFRFLGDFASAEATKGLSDRPLETFGAFPVEVNGSLKKWISCGWQGKALPCFSCNTEGFASAEATKGLSDRPLETFGPILVEALPS